MPAVRRPFATLIVLSLLTFALGLGRQAITDGDEGYYAEAAREMVESGDWLTPRFNYQDRWQKPILYYWVTSATFIVSGVSEWGARGFAAASGLALVLLTYVIGLRLLERADAAWLGAAIVATCYGYFALARLALPDLPLALFTALGIFLWLEHRPALAGLATALGFLDKGPLALVIPAVVLLPMAWRERWWNATGDGVPIISLRMRDIARAVLVFFLVSTPWYAAMVAEHGGAYLQGFFIGDNLERFATDRFNAPRAVWFYIPIVVGGIFPWTAYLLVLPWRRAVGVLTRRVSLSVNEWRLIVWTVAPLVFFTLSVGKQPRYILPVLPPLALLLASSIATRAGQAERATAAHTRELAISTWATALVYVVLAVLLLRAQPVLVNADPRLTLTGVAALVAAGLSLAWTAATGGWAALPMRMSIAAVTALLTVQFGALAGVRPEAVDVMADLVRANRSGSEIVATYKALERNLGFYTGLPLVALFDDRQALEFLDSSDRVLLVARAQDLTRLQAASNVSLKALGSVRYVDPATIRLSTLLSPLPRRDIVDILLVSNR
jgi:4-amino-4-deoxy-L-arabinose transferase-like glycosyltransferase